MFPQRARMGDLQAQGLGHNRGQHHPAILAAFALADDNLATVEINVLDAQAQSLHKPQAGPVNQTAKYRHRSFQRGQEPGHLGFGQDHRHPLPRLGPLHVVQPRQVGLQHLAVEEQDRREGLLVCRGRDPALRREPGKESRYFRRAHVTWMAHAIKADETTNPLDIT